MMITLSWPRLPGDPVESGVIDPDRIGWAGPKEQALQAPRLERLRGLALSAEMALVAAGAIDATIGNVSLDRLADAVALVAAAGLEAVPLSARRVGQGGDARCSVLITTAQSRSFVSAVLAGSDVEAISRCFGFPVCCARAFAARRAIGADPMLAMLTTVHGQVPDAHLLLPALGLGALRHVPCAADCAATRETIDRFIDTARSIDREAGDWLDRLGAWPVTWSSTGGIAEISTPYFRYHHFVGAGTCQVVANPRAGRPVIPRDPRYAEVIQRLLPSGSTEPLEALGLSRDWQRAGFDSPYAQRARYAGLLWQWSAALRGGAGDVLHYPCGDGLLGEMVAEINPRLRFLGVDDAPAAITLTRARLPGPQHRFVIDPRDLPDGEAEGRLAFVDPEPLVSRADQGGATLRAALARHKLVALYASDRALRRFGSLAALAQAAGLQIEATDATPCSARVTA